MDQLMNVIITIDKVHTTAQRVLDCRPGLGGLTQVYGPNHPTPTYMHVHSIEYHSGSQDCMYISMYSHSMCII